MGVKVTELSDEEVCCIITGLNRLSISDKDFMFYDMIKDLVKKIENNVIFVGSKI